MTDVLVVPQNKDEVAAAIIKIGKLQRQQARNATTLAQRISRLQEKAGEGKKALDDEIEVLVDGIEAWATANRDQLTESGKTKTVSLPKSTQVSWRNTPLTVKISKVEDVLAYVREHKKRRFFAVKTTYELNREALNKPSNRNEAEQIPGISFVQREIFAVGGNTITEITRNIKAAKKARPK